MTNIPAYGASVIIGFIKMGIKFEREEETDESLIMYISVPETSTEKDVHGFEMAGKHLAYRLKSTLIKMGVKRLTVKSRTRIGDHWTKEKGNEAEIEMKKMLYKSQY